MSVRAGLALLSTFALVACTGGGDSGTSSGASSGSSSSSGTGSSSGGTTCTKFKVGGTNDPMGGTATSETMAQAAADLAGETPKQVAEMLGACRRIATTLGATAEEQTSADSKEDDRGKMDAWCILAVKTLGTSKAKSSGTLSVQVDPPQCRTSVATKAACQGRCAGGGPCDTNANPMVCTGGTLVNGFCEGGELAGGCQIDAKCDAACQVTVVAAADCPKPAVDVTVTGAADAAEAAKLEAAMEADLPTVYSVFQKCKIEGDTGSGFTSGISAATDIESACIPPMIAAVNKAYQDAVTCAQSGASVLSSAGL